MKKCKVLLFSSFMMIFSLFGFIGCEVGLGEQVDTKGPEIEIISPSNLSKVHLNFTLTGTATDNVGVTEVIVSKIIGENQTKELGKATLQGEEWTFPVKLTKEDEGELTLRVDAYDEPRNQSTKSYTTISLTVDDTPPESEDWYIDRGNGISVRLNDLEYLKSINTDLSENKDIPQNMSFKIHGKVKDAISINSVIVTLKDEKGKEIISKTSEGSYTPILEFTHEDLVSANPELATGKHYLQVSYVCKDDHDNTTAGTLDWLLWYPESDLPKINEQEEIRINIQNPISVDYFDDDYIAEVYVALKMETSPQLEGITPEILRTDEAKRNAIFDEANRIKNNTDEERQEHIYTATPSSIRESTYSIKSSELLVAANMKLVVCLKDINGIWNAYITTVTITDSELPQLIINTPSENTTPTVETGTNNIKIEGYALDKRSKPGNIYSIFIKNSESDKLGITNQLITELTGTENDYIQKYGDKNKLLNAEQIAKIKDEKLGESQKVINLSFGTIKWKTTTKDKDYTDSSNEGWKKNTFEFTYDLVDELGAEGKNPKYYTLLYVDANAMKTTKLLPLNGDQTPPKITITAKAIPTVGGEARILKPMNTVNPNTDTLEISFTGVKDTGLGMKEDSYKIKRGETVITNGKTITFSANDLQELQRTVGSQPTFICEAEDKLGNKNSDQITLVLSTLPRVTSITTDNQSGTYKTGDTLIFFVNFSSEVRLKNTNNPKLKLNINGNTKYATYNSGSETKVFRFEYTVESDISCDKVTIPNTEYIELNGNIIENAGIGEGSAHFDDVAANNLKDKTLKIDSVSPTFSNIKITSTGTENGSGANKKIYAKADNVIKAVITASKPIVVSGSPKLVLKSKDGSNMSDLEFTFQGVSGNTLTFEHKITGGSGGTPNGTVELNGTSYFDNTSKAVITDKVGNTIGSLSTLPLLESETVIIDTIAPVTPQLFLQHASETKVPLSSATEIQNESQKLLFESLENGSKLYYSENEGSSWKEVTDSQRTNGVTLSGGEITVTAKQVDIAGNESAICTPKKLNIQTAFPNVTSVIVTNPDGYVKQGEKITFVVYFDDTVKLNTFDAKLTFTDKDGNNSREVTFTTTPEAGAKSLTAEYTVSATDVITGIKISSFTPGSINDLYGNKPTTTALDEYKNKEDYGYRPSIKIDGVAPTLNSKSPGHQGIQVNEGEKFTITLTFSEPVYTEKGYVTLQRIGATDDEDNWAIPPILSQEDFLNIYNQLNTDDKEILMESNNKNGIKDEKLKENVARPLGPYMKYTHGLKDDGSPDTTTKFVLAPEHDIFGTEEEGTTAKIRNVLKSIDYHKHKVDIKSNQISGNGTNVIKIQFNEAIPEGQHWAVLMEETCIRDEAQNYFAGFSTVKAYNIWGNKVAQPVIRVDRYSHNIGADEPKFPTSISDLYKVVSKEDANSSSYIQSITKWTSNGTAYNNAAADSGTKLAPTGYVKARIDCETPGAIIKFKVYTDAANNATNSNNNPPGTNNDGTNNTYDTNGKISAISNKTLVSMSTTPTESYSQGQWIFIGDGSYKTARKDYVTSYATKTSMQDSILGYEGVFKTVVNYQGHSSQIQIQGGTFNGGMPSIPDFPFRDALTENERYNQNTYLEEDKDPYNHYWVTYDIISEYSILSVYQEDKWSEKYSYGLYGQISTLQNIKHYN